MPGAGWIFSCCSREQEGEQEEEKEGSTEEQDRVHSAFRIMDRDGDGFLTWEEFSRVGAFYEDSFKTIPQFKVFSLERL